MIFGGVSENEASFFAFDLHKNSIFPFFHFYILRFNLQKRILKGMPISFTPLRKLIDGLRPASAKGTN